MPGAREGVDRYGYIPFGTGPRVCIGANFAMQTMIVTVAAITCAFRLELVPGQRITPVHRVTMRPERGIVMTLHRRAGAGPGPAPASQPPTAPNGI